MTKTILTFASLFLLIWGCTKTEVLQVDLKGDLKLKISTYSELGNNVNDKANIEITVEGTDPEIKAVTDTSGSCIINDLQMGTYNLVISKDGYGTMIYKSFKFIGSDEPYNFSAFLTHKSTTLVKSYSLGISGTTLTLSGIISHQYPKSNINFFPYNWPSLSAFLSVSPNVSSTNYVYYMNFYSNKDNDTTFTNSLTLNPSMFPSGSTVYAIIYGRNSSYYSIYDYENDSYYDPTMGDPSEVKSIVIP